jgi:phosphatidylserine/phosphatidylglycerophosphate/cardiolipin synthase-like enzyme
MSFEPDDPLVDELINYLIVAAKRGNKVELILDAYSFMMSRHNLPIGPVMLGRPFIKISRQKYFRDKYRRLEQLKSAGGSYHIIDLPSKSTIPIPFAGRSHIKCALIGDNVHVGGCNLWHTNQFDYMVNFSSPKVAMTLHDIIDRAISVGSFRKALHGRDQTIKIDDQSTLLIDAGRPGQSVIYRTALDFIDNATDWLTMTCQYSPSPNTIKHLARSFRRGINVASYYNNPHMHAGNERWLHYSILFYDKIRHPKAIFGHEISRYDTRLHAKLLASENGMIIGSQNYVVYSVLAGTGEIAIVTTDSEATSQATAKLKQEYDYITLAESYRNPGLASEALNEIQI